MEVSAAPRGQVLDGLNTSEMANSTAEHTEAETKWQKIWRWLSQMQFMNDFFLNLNALKFAPKDSIDNNIALVLVMVWN